MASRRDELNTVIEVVGRHVRRYRPFYVFALAWIVMVTVLPTSPVLRTVSGEGLPTEAYSGGLPRAEVGAGERARVDPRTGRTSAAGFAAGRITGRPSPTGLTRSGFKCTARVRQLADSAYAAPCRARWEGANGGMTSRGVTASTIKIVSRDYTDDPSTQAIYALTESAGSASREDIKKMRDVFVAYFNQTYELYGRRVVIEDFRSRSSQIDEVQNKGREQACADATAIAEERKAFAVLPPPAGLGYGPFSECAAERRLVVPIGPYGFPESWYQRYQPYAWGVQMSCDRISYHVAEYVGKRLVGRKAKWARDPLMAGQTRRFGFIGPDIAAYAGCIDLLEDLIRDRYRTKTASNYRYSVDPATMPRQAAEAVTRFKAAGVTTLVLGSDFLMNINLSRQAAAQDWGPEWVIIGAGFQDFDNYSRLLDQDRVDGHMFGISELGATEDIQGPRSEPARLYKKITGEDPPSGTDGNYFTLVHLFNMLQAAGPDLTPPSTSAGMFALPPAGPPALAFGLWRFTPGINLTHDHTAVDDAREVYWDGSATGYDGRQGTYRETYGGRRFLNGRWPSGEPPIYPDS